MGGTTQKKNLQGPIGGASGDAGVEYRRAVAAYAVAHGLAGVALSGFAVPARYAQVLAVSIETNHVVDDVMIAFEAGWRAAIQAKRTLTKGPSFKSAVAQWKLAAQRGIEPRERLALVTAKMPEWAHDLKQVLDRLRTDLPGELTEREERALRILDEELGDITLRQREALIKSASIHLLLVEEEDLQHSREATRLLDNVVGTETSGQAWRDLVVLAGKTARQRGGFRLSGWLDLLMADGRHKVVTSQATPAETIQQKNNALDHYRASLRRRGTTVDLRLLGAALAPIPLSQIDADVQVIVPGEDDRERGDLAWAFLRRGRMILTGLPGGGKSLALSISAARLLDIADAPLPVAVSLRDIDRGHRTQSFRDRLLDSAVKDLPNGDRVLVRLEIEERLNSGGAALLLDSLDETHGRRAAVVAELDEFTKTISEDVDILLATRDIAYGFAETLGWPTLRLAPPKEIDVTVREVLRAAAAASAPPKDGSWIEIREQWVTSALAKDSSLRETPLLPIMLSLLAITKHSDALPATRAAILHEMVKAIVARQEGRQGIDFRVGALDGSSAAGAILDGFTTEAITIALDEGRTSFERVKREVSRHLPERWGLPSGQADITGEAIVRFWDETGIFVMSGADEMVAPRVELFVEIGEALHISQAPDDEVSRWISEAVRGGRLESVILAAGLTSEASRQLLNAAATQDNYDLQVAAITALRQGAQPVEPEFSSLISALAEATRVGDREAWRMWTAAVSLPLSQYAINVLIESLKAFPSEHQIVARSVLMLRGHTATADIGNRHAQLLETLRLKPLSKLASRRTDSTKLSLTAVESLYSEAIVGAAAELLGQHEEAAALVVESLNHGSMNMQEQLCGLLRAHGFGQAADEFTERRWSKIRESTAWLSEFDGDMHSKLLRDLADLPKAALTYQSATRLDELADFCETMNLNDISAWPRVYNQDEWFWPLARLVGTLGNFDMATIAAQAELTLHRLENAGENSRPFFFIFDQARVRDLDAWGQVEDIDGAAQLLVRTFFRGRGAAFVAARALWKAPISEIAVPILVRALPQLKSRPQLQRIAALTMLSLTNGHEIEDWLADPNPVLRRIAAQHIPIPDGQPLPPAITTMLNDVDGYVVEASLRRLSPLTDAAVRAEVERLAAASNPGWLCLHCTTENPPGRRSCSQCHIVGPEPANLATAMLTGTTTREAIVLDLDDLED